MNKYVSFAALAAGVVLLAAALLYLLTLDNGLRPDELTGGDLITHQYAQVEGRPSNAPGYPLYTMGGWLWFRLGWLLLGWALNPVQILSLYSTLWGLAALLMLYLVLREVSGGRVLLPALLTAFYATTYFFWYYSVTTEQYTSAVFQTILIIWLAFRWDRQPTHPTLLWLALVSGTMLANMVTTLFILPPLFWFVLARRLPGGREVALFYYLRRPRPALATLGLALLPLLSYAYVYIRGTQHPEWRGAGEWPSAWAWFVQFLTIRQGRDELAPGLSLANFFTGEFPALMWQELTWPIFFGGLLGLACLGKRRAIFLYATLLIYFVFCWAYRFGNWFQVIIPAYPIVLIGVAAGLNRISESANQRMANGEWRMANERKALSASILYPLSSILYPLSSILVALLLIYRFNASLPRANQHSLPGDTGLDPGWAILADRPGSPALVSGDFEERVALQYLVTVWRVKPRLYPTAAGDFTPPPGAPASPALYISRRAATTVPVLPAGLQPQAAGEQLIALEREPRRHIPTSARPLHLDFGQGLKLVGWEPVSPAAALPGDVAGRLGRANWQVALYWQADRLLPVDYTVSVRPLIQGQLIMAGSEAVIQDHQPVWGLYPTSHWQPGQVVRDVYALVLPAGAVPDTIQVVVYHATEAGFENLGEPVVIGIGGQGQGAGGAGFAPSRGD